MKLRGFKRIAVSLAASAAMIGGLALTAPATASAAVGDYEKPGLQVEQGEFNGKNVQVTVTNPNPASFFVDGTSCSATLLDGEKALKALVAFNAGDIVGLVGILATPGLKVTPLATNSIGNNAKATATWKVEDGVYVLVGTCGGLGTVLNPAGLGVAVQPVIVPNGIGSVAPGLAFGSLLLESGDAITSVLPLLTGSGAMS